MISDYEMSARQERRDVPDTNYIKEVNMDKESIENGIPFISTEMTGADIYSSEITSADTLLRGAVLHRCGTVSLVRGRNRFAIKIPDYQPYEIEDLRIEFEGKTEHCTISRPIESDMQKASVEIEEARARIEKIEAEILSYESSLKLLEDAGKFGEGMKLTPVEFVNMADLVSEKQIEVRKRIVHLRNLKTDVEKELFELRKEVEKKKQSSEIFIDLLAPEEIICGFELTYRVSTITWVPFYEIVYQDMKSPLSVNLRGKIMRTGIERWENIRLCLIHGAAASRYDLLEPKVLRVGLSFPAPPRFPQYGPSMSGMYSGSRFDATPDYAVYGFPDTSDNPEHTSQLESSMHLMEESTNTLMHSDSSAKSSVCGFGQTSPHPDGKRFMPESALRMDEDTFRKRTPLQVGKTKVTRELAMRFDLGETYTISEKEMIIDIQEQSVPTDYIYRTVPFMDPSVYLTAKVTDFSQYNFISCEAKLYTGSTYIGSTYISGGDDELVVSLGRDESLDVFKERISKNHFETKLGREQSDRHEFRISLSNYRDETVRVQVTDRLPVSRDREVLVNMESSSGNSVFDAESGRLTWDVTLDAGARKTVEYAYSVTFPQGKVLMYEEDHPAAF